MDVLSNTTPKARKDHKCNYCGEAIPKGEIYHNQICVLDYIYQWKSHISCKKLADHFWIEFSYELQMNDGMNDDDFMEFLHEGISELEDSERIILLPKSEQIEILNKHYGLI